MTNTSNENMGSLEQELQGSKTSSRYETIDNFMETEHKFALDTETGKIVFIVEEAKTYAEHFLHLLPIDDWCRHRAVSSKQRKIPLKTVEETVSERVHIPLEDSDFIPLPSSHNRKGKSRNKRWGKSIDRSHHQRSKIKEKAAYRAIPRIEQTTTKPTDRCSICRNEMDFVAGDHGELCSSCLRDMDQFNDLFTFLRLCNDSDWKLGEKEGEILFGLYTNAEIEMVDVHMELHSQMGEIVSNFHVLCYDKTYKKFFINVYTGILGTYDSLEAYTERDADWDQRYAIF
jgi:hypothetical protein